jgi:hypothetical protein
MTNFGANALSEALSPRQDSNSHKAQLFQHPPIAEAIEKLMCAADAPFKRWLGKMQGLLFFCHAQWQSLRNLES